MQEISEGQQLTIYIKYSTDGAVLAPLAYEDQSGRDEGEILFFDLNSSIIQCWHVNCIKHHETKR